MRTWFLGLAVASGLAGGILLSRRRRRQEKVLGPIFRAAESEDIRDITVKSDQFPNGRQIVYFSGVADTTRFRYTVTFHGDMPRVIDAVFDDTETTVSMVIPTDAHYEAAFILRHLLKLVKEEGIRIDITNHDRGSE